MEIIDSPTKKQAFGLASPAKQLTSGERSSTYKFEHPRDFGKWQRLGSSDGDSVLFNSSHIYPLSAQYYLDTVQNFASGRPYAPLFLELRPTNVCNHNCIFCFSHDTRSDFARLSTARIADLIKETKSLGTPVIRFCGGGEPTAWPGITQAIEQADKADIGVTVITNGSLLGKKSESLAEHARYIRISINGGPNSHQVVHRCPPEHFAKVVENMKDISKKRADDPAIADRLYLATTYIVIPSSNTEEIYTTAKIVKDVGWDAIYFRTPTPTPPYAEKDKRLLEEQKAKCGELADDTFFPHFAGRLFGLNGDSRLNRSFCYHSQLRAYVEATGNMSFCGLYSTTKLNSMGNVNEGRFDDLWQNNEARLRYKAMDKVDCTVCPKRDTCLKCDSVYFNEATDFVVRKIKTDKDVTFQRIFIS